MQETAVADSFEQNCFQALAEKISHAKVETGADGSVWLMHVYDPVFGAIRWTSMDDFLFGRVSCMSIFELVRYEIERDKEGYMSEHSFFALENKWMEPFCGCKSAQELALKMAVLQ